MATPMSASKLLEILRAEGLTVHEVRNWRTHNRNTKGPWGPVNGVMIHHTVTSGTEASVNICYNGYSGLPGPLCHGVIDKKGEIHLVGNGRAPARGPGTRPPAAKPSYAPFPGAGFFHDGQKSPVITAMGKRRVSEGCGHYEEGPSPEWTDADRESYKAWQRKLGFKGRDAD